MNKYIFPYEMIKKDSKVVIYGLGVVGTSYLQQLKKTGYCKVFCAIDNELGKSFNVFNGLPVYTLNNAKLNQMEFDVILVSLAKKDVQLDVVSQLVAMGVNRSKIVVGGMKWNSIDCSKIEVGRMELSSKEIGKVKLCIFMLGGMGDYILSRKFIEALLKIEYDVKLTLVGNLKFINAFYGDIPQLEQSFESLDIENGELKKQYDAVFKLNHTVEFLYCDLNCLVKKSVPLHQVFSKLFGNRNVYDVKSPVQQEKDCVNLKRAKFLGMSRYTMLSHYGMLPLAPGNVTVPLKSEFVRDFYELNLPDCYVTFGFGADSTNGGNSQTKVWPKSYYEKILKALKKRYENICVVQLGARDENRIPGCDNYVMGKDIEIVKYVLKNSLLHLDCEGGLVHLATNLGTKCVVMFGPTPAYYYGYKDNINISSPVCGECMGCVNDWFVRCILGDEIPPRCMKSITPEMVLNAVESCLRSEMSGNSNVHFSN